jgi:hypothetical protein
MTLLDDTAKQLELASDSEMFGENQELFQALKFYTTDGSHKIFPTYADILASHQDLADRRNKVGWHCIHVKNVQSIKRHSVRVIPGKFTSGITAYTWELLMQLIELHLTRHCNPSLTSYSAIAHINTSISSHNNKICTKNTACLCRQPTKWPMI